MNTALLIIALLAFVILCARRFKQGMRVQPKIIRSPRLGILNLKGETVSQIQADDKSVLSVLFSSVVESSGTPPHCDVLIVYCDLADNGQLIGSTSGLRDIIRDSGAYIVLVASENSGESCIAVAQPAGYGHANLVLTIERRGVAFASFYKRLFEEMANGVSMPVAWVKMVPQIPGYDDPKLPTSIFVCEIGQIAFGNTLSYEP